MSVHVRETAKGRRYDVKFRGPDGTQHSKTFATRRAAVDYEAKQRTAAQDGAFIAPRAGTMRLTALADSWMAAGARRESTQLRNRSIVDNHILPGLGAERAVRSVTKADCQQLVDRWSREGLAPRTVARHYATLRALFQFAVDAELVARNPASRLRVPQAESIVRTSVDPEALACLAEELGPDPATFMWCGAVLGLRWAEAAALTRSSIDLAAGTVTVRQQVDRQGQLAAPKTRGSVRTLAAPAWLVQDLARLLTAEGPHAEDDLLFATDAGTALSYTNWRARVWLPATRAAGLPGLHFHDLRSLAASALVASGVDLRTAMHRLGHTTPAMTLSVYAQVAADRDRAAADAVSDRLLPGRPPRN